MLRWFEGFETCQDTDYITRKYASQSGISLFSAGRLHGKALTIGTGDRFRLPSLGIQNTWVIGFGFKHYDGTVAAIDADEMYLSFKRGAAENLRLKVIRESDTQFKFQIMRGVNILGTSALYTRNIWYYFELKVVSHPSTGSFEFRCNEVVDISDTGLNTAESGDAGVDVFDWEFDNATWYIDDMYYLDNTGAVNNDFLGDCVIEGRLPTGDGATTDWTPSAGSDHFALLDDPATTHSDTDYVSSAVATDLELLTFDSLSFITGQIYGVQVEATIHLDDEGTRTVEAKTRSGGANYDGSTWTINTTDWKTFTDIFELDPDTAALWVIAGVDAAEFGFEVVS